MHAADAVEDPAQRVITAAEAHQRHIPLAARNFFPLGQDPRATIRGARTTRAATIAATSSASAAAVSSPPIEELLNYVVEDDDDF